MPDQDGIYDNLDRYYDSSLLYKLITSPVRTLGWAPGLLYRVVAGAVTGRKATEFPPKNLRAVIPWAVESTADMASTLGGTAMTAVAHVTNPLSHWWFAAAWATDAFTGFRAFRAGFREGAGYRITPDSQPQVA